MTPQEVRNRRIRFDWSLQDLSQHSGINKAYLSEFENGKRRLSDEQLQSITDAFSKHDRGSTARPTLKVVDGRNRLVFVDANGSETYRPEIAHLRWSEPDGTSYTMFVGDPQD